MSSHRDRRPAPGLRWPLAAVVLAAAPACLARQTAAPVAEPASSQPEAEAGLPDLTEVKKTLVELRGLEFKRDVPSRKQSVEEWGEYISGELDKYFPPETQEGMQQGLLRLGMLLKPIDIGRELKGALLSQAAAYYDPRTGNFYYLMTDMPVEMVKVVAAHELMHALQDQHFDLGKLMEEQQAALMQGTRNDDRLLAMSFLVEGEATYVMTAWQAKTMAGMDLAENPAMESMQFRMLAEMDLSQLVEMTKQAQLPMFEDEDNALMKAMQEIDTIPPYLLHPLYASYMQGAYFAMSLRQHGGWEAIDAAFESLPISSEQVLHPEKYTTERDDPTPMELPALTGLAAAGWKQIDAANHGEFYLNLLLRNFKTPKATADAASAGWDGDVYGAFRDADGRVMIALATTWDSEQDAAEFFEAYRSILSRKYPDLDAAEEGETAMVYDCGDESLGRGRLARRGREVFAVEGAPEQINRVVFEALMAQAVTAVE